MGTFQSSILGPQKVLGKLFGRVQAWPWSKGAGAKPCRVTPKGYMGGSCSCSGLWAWRRAQRAAGGVEVLLYLELGCRPNPCVTLRDLIGPCHSTVLIGMGELSQGMPQAL